jgi:DNA mismatch repair protein MutS2
VIPPVGSGTRLPVFGRLFSDIGDHQSIAASLSTFSAHVSAVRDVLEEADARSLVLVDEIGGGTDPGEGAALAAAVVLALLRRGVTTIVTTHLAQLKELAAQHAGVENGSLEFDAATLTPTYRFLQGMPGRSYGLAIARRLGVQPDVLAEAEATLPASQRSLEALLADLEAKAQVVERRSTDVTNKERQLAAHEGDLEHRQREVERRESEALQQSREHERLGREQARQFLLEARRRVEDALALARAAVTEATAREARRLVEDGVQQEAEALKKLRDQAGGKGWRVKGKTGERATSNVQRATGPDGARSTMRVARTEVDLRGLTGDDAHAAVSAAIDDAVVNDLPVLRLIHGKGTGALRAAVQALLAGDSRVAAFKLAPVREGGSGVTIVELKA